MLQVVASLSCMMRDAGLQHNTFLATWWAWPIWLCTSIMKSMQYKCKLNYQWNIFFFEPVCTMHMCIFYSISWQYVSLNISDWTFKHLYCALTSLYCQGTCAAHQSLKAALASPLNGREMWWLILSSNSRIIDNHDVTSSVITSTALRARQKIPGPFLPIELRSTWKKQK